MFTLCRQPQSSKFRLRVMLTLIVLPNLIATSIIPLAPSIAPSANARVMSTQETAPDPSEEFGQLPLQFELNQGQTDPQVQFDAPDGNFNGFNFWLSKLDQFGGDYRQAEMVKAFLSSSEYRERFGQF